MRSLLSTIVGQVINDVTGTGLRAAGDNGISGVTIELDQFSSSTGVATHLTTTTTDTNGLYQFTNLPAGSYLVKEPAVPGTFQTAPTAEETPQSYLVQFTSNNQTAGGTLAAPLPMTPADNWLASLAPSTYNFPLAGDFMFQLGPNGTAPTRVFLSGQATVATQAPIVTTGSTGEGTSTTDVTVNTTMTSLQLVGTVSSDQHGQGYLGTITMTLDPSAPSTGQITSRSDSIKLVDSSFNINATLTIPSAFGTPTVLHTSVPINFLAKELSQFPGFGGNYAHNGTGQPISLLDSNNQEQGTLIFGNLAPMPGYDFANFAAATIQGQAYIKGSPNTPLVNQPIIFQKVAEVAGPTSEGGSDSGSGSGGSNGSGGPPAGMGPAPTTPITVYTDANGNFSFTGLGPGSYTLQEPNGSPLTLDPANNTGLGSDGQTYTISSLQSGSTVTYNFDNTFTPGLTNQSTALNYPVATQTIIPNLNIGGTAFANNSGNSAYINDGVTFGSTLFAGATEVPLKITVVVPQGDTAYLSGWLDAVHNGTFNDSGGTVPSDLIQYNTGTSSAPSYSSLDNYVFTA
ncbi:MAG: SdrD B-like domain-containing protein [Isosphaeraceae bacterium]